MEKIFQTSLRQHWFDSVAILTAKGNTLAKCLIQEPVKLAKSAGMVNAVEIRQQTRS